MTKGLFVSVLCIDNLNTSKHFISEREEISGVVINADCGSATRLFLDVHAFPDST